MSSQRQGAWPLSVFFQCCKTLQEVLYRQALTPTGSVNRGQVLKSNPPILTSIKDRGGPSKHLGRAPPFKHWKDWFQKEAL